MFKNQADTIKRAEKFVPEALADGYIYHLIYPATDDKQTFSLEDFFVIESHQYYKDDDEPLQVMPFWSSSYLPYARKYGKGLGVEMMPLEVFINEILPLMIESNTIAGLNWDGGGAGVETEAVTVLNRLRGNA